MRKRIQSSNKARSAHAWAAPVCRAGLFACIAMQGANAAPRAQGSAEPLTQQDLRPVILAAKASAATSSVKQSEVAGRYFIFRENGKDTGCMLTLDDKAKGKGGNRATLAPACRDQGLVIFDPVGWQIINGHLVLTARKGHTTRLDQEPDGTWLKDPKEGKSLSLKKQ